MSDRLGVDEERVRLWTFARVAVGPRDEWSHDWFQLTRTIAPVKRWAEPDGVNAYIF